MNYIFCVFAPPNSNYRQNLYSIVNNDNFLNMFNDEKFGFLLKFKWKMCLYLLRESMGQKNRNII